MKDNKKLSFLGVAIIYIGTIMGAGFASGREVWQYFGIFGLEAYNGIALATALFAILALMVCYLGIKLETNDIGTIILPFKNEAIANAIGYLVAFFIYLALVSMSAAGGSLLNQQFGISKVVGGAIIVFLTIITVLGDFERVSKVFAIIMPILFTIDVGLCLYVIIKYPQTSGIPPEAKPSPMAASWYVSALVYVSYNVLGTIPIMSKAALNCKSKFQSLLGAITGGIGLGLLGLILVLSMSKDGFFCNSLDLPMLGYARKISTPVNIIFTTVLFFAIYSAATSTYYGFTSKLSSKNKRTKVILFACLGFFLGLFGFKNLIYYVYPIDGYLGIVVLILIIINFFKVLISQIRGRNER